MAAHSTELLKLEEVHRAAQAWLGLSSASVSLLQWSTVDPKNPTGTASRYVDASLRAVMVLRRRSARLAKAYYQYARALEIGVLMGEPDLPPGTPVTLNALRSFFLQLLQESMEMGSGEVRDDADESWFDEVFARALNANENPRTARLLENKLDAWVRELESVQGSDNPRLRMDKFTWPVDASEDKIRAIFKKKLDDYAINALAAKNADADKKARESEHEPNAEARERQRAKDHDKSGSHGAGYMDLGAISAGRSMIQYAARRDTRVLKVARGTSSNPCYWCAMLASRGFVYSSATAAGFNSQGVSDWHPNCHCYPIYRWTNDALLPATNQYYMDLWNKHIRDPADGSRTIGHDSINKWRNLLVRLAREQKRKDATTPGG